MDMDGGDLTDGSGPGSGDAGGGGGGGGGGGDGGTSTVRAPPPSYKYSESVEVLARQASEQAEAQVQAAAEDRKGPAHSAPSQKWSSLSYSTSMDDGEDEGDEGDEVVEGSFDSIFNDLCMRSGISFDEEGVKVDDRSGEVATDIMFGALYLL